MSADSNELRKFGADLAESGLKAHNRAVQVVQKVAADVTADAKSFAPVYTGNLKNSIGYDLFNKGGEVGAEIGPTASYAIHQEFGTSRMAPQPFLNPAFDRHIGNFERAMGKLGGIDG